MKSIVKSKNISLFVKQFLFVYSFFFFLSILFAYYTYKNDMENEKTMIFSHERSILEREKILIDNTLLGLIADIRFAASDNFIINYASNRKRENLDNYLREFETFFKKTTDLKQLWLLDAENKLVFTSSSKNFFNPVFKTDFKYNDNHYLEALSNLSYDQLYFSTTKLLHQKASSSFVPTDNILIAIPVRNNIGNKAATLIIELDNSSIFKQISSYGNYRTSILRSDKSLLLGEEKRINSEVINSLWETISKEPYYQYLKNDECFSSARISINNLNNENHIITDDLFWVLTSHFSKNEFQVLRNSVLKKIFFQFTILALILMLTSFYIAKYRVKLIIEKESLQDYVKRLEKQKSELENNTIELRKLNDLLFDSEQELKTQINDKDKFVSIISHDLRNPMGTLLGYVDFLYKNKNDLTEDELEYSITGLRDISSNLWIMLEELLLWAKSKSKNLEVNPSEINLQSEIQKVIQIQSANIQKKKLSVRIEIEKTKMLFADLNIFKTCMRNLLSNAIKFSREGGIITVGINSTNETTTIYISDNGVGISEEDLNKIFKTNMRHTTIGTSSEKGNGLGLKFCRELMEKHNGNLRAESIVEKGSTFFLDFPTT